jgi:F-type H+-transporting ATPase subunit delta
MSSLTTLARPYAKAAFEVANGQQQLAGWHNALATAALVVENDKVAAWLGSPDLDVQQVLKLISDASSGKLDEHFERFLSVLAENDRLTLLPQIKELFAGLRAEAENRLEVRVVSAYPLAEDQSERMKAALARRFERNIELHNEVDAAMLGGAIIYAGDEVIDGSVMGRVARLQSSLA